MRGRSGNSTLRLWMVFLHSLSKVDEGEQPHSEYYRHSSFVYHNFVVASFDKAPAEVLQLLPSLHKQVTTSRRELDENAFPRVSSPYVKSWVSRTAMDGQKIEVGVKAGKYGILLVIFHKIRGCWCQEVRARHGESEETASNDTRTHISQHLQTFPVVKLGQLRPSARGPQRCRQRYV